MKKMPFLDTENTLLPTEEVARLTEAFEQFSKKTAHLEEAYASLKREFHSVNLKLEQTNQTLQEKVVELEVTTRSLHSILNHMNQGMLFIASSGQIRTCNPATKRWFSLKEEAPFWDLFADHTFGFSMRDALATGKAPETIHVHYETSLLEVSTSFVRQGPEEHQGIILLIRDVTEVQRLQQQLQRHDRLKELGEMAASLAHEIRNPLGGIEGFASLLARDLREQPQACEMAEQIIEGARDLNRLVTNVLNYARPLTPSLQRQLLGPFLEQFTQSLQKDPAFAQQSTFSFENCPHECWAIFDGEHLYKALLNLVENALEAMPEKGTLRLRLRRKDNRALISLEDEGKGIRKEEQEKVFSPFFSTKTKGGGMGLSEVYKIVEVHEGSIDLSSTVGKGTTVTIGLPLCSEV